jgi:hypothetical protein
MTTKHIPDPIAERRCRQRIERAIGHDTGTMEALAALCTALTDEAMLLEKDGRRMGAPELKEFLGALLEDVVDVCLAQDQAKREPGHE